ERPVANRIPVLETERPGIAEDVTALDALLLRGHEDVREAAAHELRRSEVGDVEARARVHPEDDDRAVEARRIDRTPDEDPRAIGLGAGRHDRPVSVVGERLAG